MSSQNSLTRGKSIARNAAFQVGGRLFISAIRLAIAIIIIRLVGAERYGEYSLILSFMIIAEWLVDFGITDIGVRDISRTPEREQLLLRAVTILASGQAVLAFSITVIALYSLGYPEYLVRAGVIAGISLFFYAAIIVYRIQFRARMSIGQDVLGESIGVFVMLPLVVLAGIAKPTIDVFMGCYLVSRMIHAGTVAFLGRESFRLSAANVPRNELTKILWQAVPLGIGGLLFSLNENLATVILAKFASINAVAEYQYAVRFVIPIIMIVQSLNVAFFPVLSGYWKSDRKKFSETQQNALEASVLVGAGLFCLVFAGAEFLLGIAGAELLGSGFVFRLMSCVALLQVVTLSITTLIVVAGGVHKVLWLTAALVAAQLLALLWLVPLYGTVGAALAYFGVKLLVGTGPIIVIAARLTGVRLRWAAPAKTILSAGAALTLAEVLFGLGPLWVALFSALLYCVFLLASGALTLERARMIRDTARNRAVREEGID